MLHFKFQSLISTLFLAVTLFIVEANLLQILGELCVFADPGCALPTNIFRHFQQLPIFLEDVTNACGMVKAVLLEVMKLIQKSVMDPSDIQEVVIKHLKDNEHCLPPSDKSEAENNEKSTDSSTKSAEKK